MTPGDVIDELLQESKDLSSTTAPEWGYWDNKEFNDSVKIRAIIIPFGKNKLLLIFKKMLLENA